MRFLIKEKKTFFFELKYLEGTTNVTTKKKIFLCLLKMM